LPPVQSGYGIHLVYVSALQKEHRQPFDIVEDRVLEDWKLKQQQVYNERLYENLLKKYEVVYELEN